MHASAVDLSNRLHYFAYQVDALFKRFDSDNDGVLDKGEYRQYLEATGAWGRGLYVETSWQDEVLWQKELSGLGSASKAGRTCSLISIFSKKHVYMQYCCASTHAYRYTSIHTLKYIIINA